MIKEEWISEPQVTSKVNLIRSRDVLTIAASQKKEEKAFWLKKLAGELPKITFPYDNQNHDNTGNGKNRIKFRFSRDVYSKINKLSNYSPHKCHMILVAGVVLLLNRYTDNNDIILGSPVVKQEKVEKLINTLLVLRHPINHSSAFKDLLYQVRDVITEATNNQNFPLELLKDKIIEYSPETKYPFFNIAILLKNIHDKEYIQHIDPDTVFSFIITDDYLEGELEYNLDLYHQSTIERIITHLKTLLEKILFNPGLPIKTIDMLTDSERKKILYEFNDTSGGSPHTKTVCELFELQVKTTPGSVAVIHENKQITYLELNERANRLAFLLREKGVKPNIIAALLVTISIDTIISILGVLKSGGAYLPIDPEYPEGRIISILQDSHARIVLAGSNQVDNISFAALQGFQLGNGYCYQTRPRKKITDLGRLPIPDRSLVDYETYMKHIGQAAVKNCISIQGTRGCPYKCLYCLKIYPGGHVVRSAEDIFAEINMYYDMGVKRFALIDDVFNLDVKNSRRFFELIIHHQLDIQLFFPNGLRGDILSKDYIDLMVKAGTTSIALALETASPRLQRLIGKNLNLKKLKENIEYICETYPQIILELFIMHGFPTETEEEAEQTMEFVKRLKWVHFPYISILTIFPNTEMEKLALQNGVSMESIYKSACLADHEFLDTLPFRAEFTRKYQADFLEEYFLLKERLLQVLPIQMNIFSEDEIVEKYNSYLPGDINNFNELLQVLGITKEEIGNIKCSDSGEDNRVSVGLNAKMKESFGREEPAEGALKILLIDLSQFFSRKKKKVYDIFEPPLGLMYIMSYLNQSFGNKIDGRIIKSRVDFDSYFDLKQIITNFNPDIIGIRSLTYYRDFFHKTIAFIKQWRNNVPIIAGGPYPMSDYKTILQDRNVDLVVYGEGEITFSELIKDVLENDNKFPGEERLKKIPGIIFIPGSKKASDPFARDILDMDSSEEILMDKPGENLSGYVDTCMNDLAYTIYTSGSTGNPKGVMINNKSFTDFTTWAVREFEHKPGYHVLLSNSFASDGSVQQIFPPLVSGGTLHLIDRVLRLDIPAYISYLRRNRINNIDEVPTLMNALFDTLNPDTNSELLPDLTCLSLGSEYVPIELVRKCRKYLNNKGKIINGYGPAEASVETCTYPFDGWSQNERSLIGKPRENLNVYILDRHNHWCPIGVPGEIAVSGIGIARGYLNNPESTARVFIKNRYGDKHHDILYKTRDRGTWLPDGNIEFLGRIDSQVQVRGYRVEPDEIKYQLLKHSDLQDAAVILKEGEENNNYLCAYIVIKEAKKHKNISTNGQSNKTTLDTPGLRDYLSRTLPDYMIPAYFVEIDSIPLTPNGKIDKESLPDPKRISGKDYLAPGNEIEEKLEEIWSSVLGIEKIGIKDNFFKLGGDSIKTIQISARMRKYGYRIEMRDIFQNPTIMDLASLVKKDEKISEQSAVTGVVKLTPIQRHFFEDNNIDRHHYNQSIMFKSKEGFSKEAIKTIFTKLQEHHDSLRMRYIEKNGEIEQVNEGLDYPLSLDEYDLKDQEDGVEKLGKKANEIQGGINLANGPLMKLGLFHLADGDRLLIVIHHLVIDGVSWRILFEDIETLYNQYQKGETLELPLKTDSFKLWSEQLSGYSNSDLFLIEKSYWKKIDSIDVPPIKRDFEVEGNNIKDTESMSFRLSKEETNELLTRVNELFGTEINDILLTGLGIGISETFGNEKVLIAMEGHGREEIIKGIDISRTVGWFTSEFPVILDMSYRGDMSRQVKEVKESLHQVPNKGIGYGILKYLTSGSNKSGFEFKCEPQVGFNYLGQFDTDVNRPSFEIAEESSGSDVSIDREKDFEIDIAGMISDGQLGISINYNKNHYKPETMRRLINNYKQGLRNITSYCTGDRPKELTPSDFGIKELSIDEFDSLFDS